MSPGIYIPISLIASIPFFLWLFVKPPFRMVHPGTRFRISSQLILFTWFLAKLLFWHAIDIWYWSAGLLFIAAFLIFAFMLWSVLSWGYTLCMLSVLQDVDHAVTLQEWQQLHTGAAGTKQLTFDRVDVLLRFGLARLDGHRVILSKRGARFAFIFKACTHLFGVKL